MDKSASQKIVRDTLQAPFNKERFLYFVKNLLNKVDESKAFHAKGYVAEAYKPYVKTYERLATYTDPEGNKIDILAVYLQKETSLERARTAQRNFLARYLKERDQKDAGLVAFVSPNSEDWRFSLVKMDYKFVEGKGGRIKVQEEFTPARRWSFLVGKNEDSHTAQSRLSPVVQEDNFNPTLTQLEDAFNIEKVTKEFFEKYRDLFWQTQEALENLIKKDNKIKQDFATKGIETEAFAKKLLGQIVFLYFLQKKGWFGVGRDDDWGTGPKNFLRQLYEGKHGAYKNFFNDILEPLFYEALAREREDDFYSRFNCRIPFLNGGLFDPINNYDWVHIDVLLPNDSFSNSLKTKEGDTGTGILDIFDRYNFTVKEDEPLEKEVAVDPEMLGKVFENLLEVKDRKSKGTYYTPREIVHYMCEQSLINYLATELEGNVSKSDIEQLIRNGESVGENEAKVESNGKETNRYSYLLPDGVRKNAKLIDVKLADIKVCDPAIGSGAFPVGMMAEIVKGRNVLTNYINDPKRSPYNFKRNCIQNSLYGVDVDPGAVEIAKLRLWLSLVVDEEDIKQIRPLPNLDYKIMQGNSLLEEFEGIKLFDEKLISPNDVGLEKQFDEIKEKQDVLQKEFLDLHFGNKLNPGRKNELEIELKKLKSQLNRLKQSGKTTAENASLFDILTEAKKKADELKRLHKDFFEATQKSKKDWIKKQIEQLEWDLIEVTLKEQSKSSAIKKLEEFKRSNVKPFFLWKLHFADVFEDGGFDIVIGNPPYIEFKKLPNSDKENLKRYNSAKGKYDIYVIFDERAYEILKIDGILAFIQPTTFIKKDYGSSIRNFIMNNFKILAILDFADTQVFECATNYTGVFLLKKIISKENYSFIYHQYFNTGRAITVDEFQKSLWQHESNKNKNVIQVDSLLLNQDWNFVNDDVSLILNKLYNCSIDLGNIAFAIFQGIASGKDSVFYVNEEIIQEYNLEKTLLKKLLKGRDLKKYKIKWSGYYVIYPYDDNSIVMSEAKLIKEYPNIYNYLKMNRSLLNGRGYFDNSSKRWYELWNQRNATNFKESRIVCPEISNQNNFMITDEYYGNTKTYHIILNKEKGINYYYILSLLNSKLIDWVYKKLSTPHAGGYYAYKSQFLTKIPIKKINEFDQKPFIDLVNKILAITKDDDFLQDPAKQAKTKDLEQQIDRLVYNLYGLDPEEVDIVENSK